VNAHVKRAARVGPEAARDTALDTPNDTHEERNTQAGKALAVWLFNVGAVSMDETAAKFAQHPAWRSA
jgi:hypothetical protein